MHETEKAALAECVQVRGALMKIKFIAIPGSLFENSIPGAFIYSRPPLHHLLCLDLNLREELCRVWLSCSFIRAARKRSVRVPPLPPPPGTTLDDLIPGTCREMPPLATIVTDHHDR